MQLKVAIVSAGLGNIARGFEVTASLWHKELAKHSKALSMRLFAGGVYPTATKVFNLPRNGRAATMLRRLQLIKDGCRLEQRSFCAGFFFQLLRYRPDVIWLQEGELANGLLRLRKIFGFRYKIVFCDGAPAGHLFASKFDAIVFLHQDAYDAAIADGINEEKCVVIPHLAALPKQHVSRELAREKLGLPPGKFITICVATWNKHHKRIDHLLNEFAMLSQQEHLLLLCGQPEGMESEELKALAQANQINAVWWTLDQENLSFAYAAADMFVLPSVSEGLPGVVMEAAAHGLPIACHPHAGGRYILGDAYEGLIDMRQRGALATFITRLKKDEKRGDLEQQTQTRVLEKFNRQKLVCQLEAFIFKTAEA